MSTAYPSSVQTSNSSVYRPAWPRSSGVTAIIIAGSAITAITTVVVSNVTSTIAAVNTAIGSANTSGTATSLVSHVCLYFDL